MAERYTVLQHNTKPFYIVDCPILLVSHALTKDNQNNNIFIQCKFENMLAKSIKALYVHVNCFDVMNNPLSDVDSFSYLDIEIRQHQTFGDKTPIVLPDKETRNFSVIPTKIVFTDGSVWENDSSKCFELFSFDNTPISKLGELAEEYNRELHAICAQSSQHKYLPVHKDGYTVCGCGKILADENKVCPACSVNLEKLFALNDLSSLKNNLEQYRQIQKDEYDKAQQKEILDKQKRKIKQKKITILTVGLCAILSITGIIYTTLSRQQYRQALERTQTVSNYIDCNLSSIIALCSDGSISVAGKYKFDETRDWEDITAVSLLGGEDKAIGYGANGDISVASLFRIDNFINENLKDTTLVTEDGMDNHVVILKSDGTVVASGNNMDGECNVEDWSDIVDVSTGLNHTIGLKSDGTVVATGDNSFGQCDVDGWDDIIDVSAGSFYSLGLKSDGTVVATGDNSDGQCDVEKWKNIVHIDAKGINTLGLKSDGTIVLTGRYEQDDIEKWTDIVAVSTDLIHVVGVKSDGTLVTSGYGDDEKYDVSEWDLW